jgi:hypothetical protein
MQKRAREGILAGESGKRGTVADPKIRTLRALARALGVSVRELVDEG